MSFPIVNDLPDAPTAADQGEAFNALAFPLMAALQPFVSEVNAVGAALMDLANTAFSATSASNVAIGTGAKNFAASAGAAFIGGQSVIVSSAAAPGVNYMTGTVTSYNRTSGALVVNVTAIGPSASGSHADWSIALNLSGGSYLPLAGGTLTGLLIAMASASGGAGFRLSVGTAPSAPTDGDIWITSAGIFVRVAGTTLQLASLAGAETLTNKTLSNLAAASTVLDGGGTGRNIGFRDVPVDSNSSARALALADAGKTVLNTTGGWSIPANASVAFPIGTTISLYNDSASGQSITITSDTLRRGGTTDTGTRTLAARGIATLHKIKSTEWIITGAGLS